MSIIRDRYGRTGSMRGFGNHEPLPDRWETSGTTTWLGYGGVDDSEPMMIHKVDESAGTLTMAWGLWSERASLTYQSVNSYVETEE